MKKIKTTVSIIFTALFTSALFAGFMFTASKCISGVKASTTDAGDYSFFENRLLAAFPSFDAKKIRDGDYLSVFSDRAGILDGSWFSSVDTFIVDHSAARNTVLEADTYANLYLLRRPVVNEVVVCDDILLPWNEYETVDESDITQRAETIAERLDNHARTAAEYGGYFCYVAVPCQYVYFEDEYPSYLNSRHEYTEKSSSALFTALNEHGVNYIDMRSHFEELGNPAVYSSRVDNHYGIEGALETYNVILNRINDDTGLALKPLSPDEYTIETLPNRYLGSRSRKLFGMWRSDEHLSVLNLRKDIPFRRFDYSREVQPYIYAYPQAGEDVLYTMYMGGDKANTVIETDRDELPNILIYGDSFTNALESIIWYNCNTMYSLDLRQYKDMTIDEFIAEYKPDIILCVRDYESILDTTNNGQ